MSDYLKQVEDQLVELTERGAHRRPRPRLDVLAVGSAVAVVAVVAIVISAIGGRAPRHAAAASHRASTTTRVSPRPTDRSKAATGTISAAPAGSPPAGGPVPAGFGPQSFTAISEFTWWLLGSAPCSSPPCTSIVRTTDGGRTFVGIPAPRPRDPKGSDAVSQLRFANSQDGYAYGPGLWETRDGGAHWQSDAPGQIRELAIGGGYAYAILITNPSQGLGQLIRAPIGEARFWKTMPAAGFFPSGGLWVHGSDVLLEGERQPGGPEQLEVSHDSGATFTRYAAPPSVACQFEEPAPPVVWTHCATGMMSGTWVSTTGGANFAAVKGSGLPELPNSAAFGSASGSTAVVGYRQLYRTTDGGATWTQSTGPVGISSWQYLGFTDPTHGVAVGYVGSARPSNERLYYTTDGGASYHLVSVG